MTPAGIAALSWAVSRLELVDADALAVERLEPPVPVAGLLHVSHSVVVALVVQEAEVVRRAVVAGVYRTRQLALRLVCVLGYSVAPHVEEAQHRHGGRVALVGRGGETAGRRRVVCL